MRNLEIYKTAKLIGRFKAIGLSADDVMALIKYKKKLAELAETYAETRNKIFIDHGIKSDEEYLNHPRFEFIKQMLVDLDSIEAMNGEDKLPRPLVEKVLSQRDLFSINELEILTDNL